MNKSLMILSCLAVLTAPTAAFALGSGGHGSNNGGLESSTQYIGPSPYEYYVRYDSYDRSDAYRDGRVIRTDTRVYAPAYRPDDSASYSNATTSTSVSGSANPGKHRNYSVN